MAGRDPLRAPAIRLSVEFQGRAEGSEAEQVRA
jgi:hypothetical protein